jgi:response regulator NasT
MKPVSDRAPPGGRLRVLLIDDGAHRVQSIREELTRQGHEVVGVIDSATLVHDCVQRLAPDVVIVDSESPTRDTLENLATLSAANPTPGRRVQRGREP